MSIRKCTNNDFISLLEQEDFSIDEDHKEAMLCPDDLSMLKVLQEVKKPRSQVYTSLEITKHAESDGAEV